MLQESRSPTLTIWLPKHRPQRADSFSLVMAGRRVLDHLNDHDAAKGLLMLSAPREKAVSAARDESAHAAVVAEEEKSAPRITVQNAHMYPPPRLDVFYVFTPFERASHRAEVQHENQQRRSALRARHPQTSFVRLAGLRRPPRMYCIRVKMLDTHGTTGPLIRAAPPCHVAKRFVWSRSWRGRVTCVSGREFRNTGTGAFLS